MLAVFVIFVAAIAVAAQQNITACLGTTCSSMRCISVPTDHKVTCGSPYLVEAGWTGATQWTVTSFAQLTGDGGCSVSSRDPATGKLGQCVEQPLYADYPDVTFCYGVAASCVQLDAAIRASLDACTVKAEYTGQCSAQCYQALRTLSWTWPCCTNTGATFGSQPITSDFVRGWARQCARASGCPGDACFVPSSCQPNCAGGKLAPPNQQLELPAEADVVDAQPCEGAAAGKKRTAAGDFSCVKSTHDSFLEDLKAAQEVEPTGFLSALHQFGVSLTYWGKAVVLKELGIYGADSDDFLFVPQLWLAGVVYGNGGIVDCVERELNDELGFRKRDTDENQAGGNDTAPPPQILNPCQLVPLGEQCTILFNIRLNASSPAIEELAARNNGSLSLSFSFAQTNATVFPDGGIANGGNTGGGSDGGGAGTTTTVGGGANDAGSNTGGGGVDDNGAGPLHPLAHAVSFCAASMFYFAMKV